MDFRPGKITTVCSTMFGGKSVYALHKMESLSRSYRKFYGNKKVVAYINHCLDDRKGADSVFSTHSDIISAQALEKIGVNCRKETHLSNIKDDYIKEHKAIFIDEAQFFPDLIKMALHISEDLGVDVYAVGLSTDYKRDSFGDLGYLSTIAEEALTLRALCGFCSSKGLSVDAIFNYRIEDKSGNQIEVGSDNYVAVCRKCYIDKNKK